MSREAPKPVTQKSGSAGFRRPVSARNCPESQGFARQARNLLHLLPMALLMALLASGCVIPLPFEDPARDGGSLGNYPPIIVDSDPDLSGPISVPTSGSLSIVVEDKDIGDKIYVRVFRGYARIAPTPPRIDNEYPNDSVAGMERRPISLSVIPFCSDLTPAERGIPLYFDILVADGPWADTPDFQTLADEDNRAKTHNAWVGTCPTS